MSIKGVARLGDMDSGHGGFNPRGSTGGSPDVFVNGIAVHRVGDEWPRHSKGKSGHDSITTGGSSTVFCNGRAVARIGDTLNCGSIIAQGSTDVFCG